jgi:transposase-like protein
MRKHYTPEFKAATALEALREEKILNQIASERGIHPTMLSKWKAEAEKGLPMVFRKETTETDKLKAAYEAKIEELYKQIGRLTTDLDWLKKKSGK